MLELVNHRIGVQVARLHLHRLVFGGCYDSRLVLGVKELKTLAVVAKDLTGLLNVFMNSLMDVVYEMFG